METFRAASVRARRHAEEFWREQDTMLDELASMPQLPVLELQQTLTAMNETMRAHGVEQAETNRLILVSLRTLATSLANVEAIGETNTGQLDGLSRRLANVERRLANVEATGETNPGQLDGLSSRLANVEATGETNTGQLDGLSSRLDDTELLSSARDRNTMSRFFNAKIIDRNAALAILYCVKQGPDVGRPVPEFLETGMVLVSLDEFRCRNILESLDNPHAHL